jgi:signal transduction histidine kinase
MAEYSAPPVEMEGVTSDWADQLAAMERRATQAERQRLARDVHDSVTQTLISLHLSAQAAAELWDTQPTQARAALETVRHLATDATTEMRGLLVDRYCWALLT